MKYMMLLILWGTFALNAVAQDHKKVDLPSLVIEAQVDQLVKAYQDLDIFSGVVLIAQAGQPYYHKAFGLANREKNIPNTLDTKFDIGSMNKTFTKVLVLQLATANQLQLDDPLGKYLEGFPEKVAKQVTVGQLLTHSSGFGDYHTPDYFEAPSSQKTIVAITEQAKEMPLLFEPGTEEDYSNTGYILLGAIIEKVTGKTYHQNIKERILKPLNLHNTYVENIDEVPNRSTGYFKNMRGEIRDNERLMDVPNPDGGFQSTTLDILTFYNEYHYGDQLLRKEARQLDVMWPFIEEHRTTGGAIPHAGGFEGANTVIYEILRDQISVVVFANMDEVVAEQLGAGILAIIRGKEPQAPSLPAVQNVYQAMQKEGLAYVKAHFDELSVNFHPQDPRDLILNDVGYELLFAGETEEAIRVFQLNTELFPEVANVWDSLGEAWLKKGDRKKALQYYKKALAIRPDLPSAREAVRKLE